MQKKTQLKIPNKGKSYVSTYPLITFAVTMLLIMALYWKNGIAPLGIKSFLDSDLKAQYAPFLVFWKHHLAKVDFKDFISSFTYSKDLGWGNNVCGTLGYYLLSPFNLIVLFVNSRYISAAISVIVMLKLSLSSAFMCLFLERRNNLSYESKSDFDKRSKFPIVLGIAYAFTAYAIVFAFNIMWLDGYYLLPLLLYLLEGYLHNHKYRGIVVTLVLLFLANYYIAYMVGIASFFYLVLRLIEINSETSLAMAVKDRERFMRRYINPIIKYVLIAILCALICSIILVPNALNTLHQADPTAIANNREFTFKALEMVNQFYLGSSGDFNILSNNLPYVFSSLLVTISVLIYFLADVFDKKTKRIRLATLIFVFCLFYVSKLDVICQAFDSPNWFCHRYSFVLYPFLFTICMEVVKDVKKLNSKVILRTAVILIAILVGIQSLSPAKMEEQTILVNLIGILFYSTILCLMKRDTWHKQLCDMPALLPVILAITVITETSLINTQYIKQSCFVCGVNADLFSQFVEIQEKLGELSNEGSYEDDLYRTEYENLGGYTDTDDIMYANVDGISLFNSISNKSAHRFLKQLGYVVNFNYFAAIYNHSMPSTDAFLSVKHIITETPYSLPETVTDRHISALGINKSQEIEEANYYLYKYNQVLPLAFPIQNTAMTFDFYALENKTENKNYFEFQQEWYQSMFPHTFTEDRNFYIMLSSENVVGPMVDSGFTYKDGEYGQASVIKVQFKDKLGTERIKDYKSGLTNYVPISTGTEVRLGYEVTMPQSGELYLNLSSPQILNDCEIYVNDKLFTSFSDSYSVVTRLGFFNQGDTVEITISSAEGLALEGVYFAVFDGNSFDNTLAELDTSAVQVNRYTNGHMEFTVDTSRLTEENSIVLTTIPYDEGWTCYIDGVKSDFLTYQNALIAVPMQANGKVLLDGQVHKVELKFEAPGVKLGAVCSIIGILMMVLLGVYDIRKTKGNDKKYTLKRDMKFDVKQKNKKNGNISISETQK